jgi:hypothetical protein
MQRRLARRIRPDGKLPDGQAGQLFDIAKIGSLLVAAQRDRYPGGTGAGGSANAMDIILRHVWQLEIDDVRHALHIDATGGDVGGHEHPGVTGTEAGERAFALGLRFVAMDSDGLDTGSAQMPHDPVRTVLCASKDEHPRKGRIAQH